MTSARPLRRPFILAAVMASSFMIAIEATIVATAMPQIVSHLGELRLYAWVFASFLLAQSTATVVFGRLADIYGRKATLLAGLAVFLVGSVLCGFAWSMLSLVLFRLVQGLGAGATQPVAITVVGDLYPAHERGKVQGWIASVWGVSSVLGPLAGGLIIQNLHWAWVFWINVPLCLGAAALFHRFLHEDLHHERHPVDYLGALLFAVLVASLMIALTEAGGPGAGTARVALLISVIAAPVFIFHERRTPAPMIDFRLWGRRALATANLATLLSAMAVVGLTTFLPMYVQAVLGRSALVAGFTLTVMVLGWPIAATIAAKNLVRFGLRPTLLFGAALLPVGAVAFVLPVRLVSPVELGLGSLVIGFGMGFVSTPAIIIVQDSVGWAERGVATASNVFARNIGSTLGAAVLGAVLNLSLAAGRTPVTSEQIKALIDRGGTLAAAEVRAALGQALQHGFWGVLVIAALTFAAALRVPPVALPDRRAG